MAGLTWIGDEDPSVQVITMYGFTFVKGEPTKVETKDKAVLAKFAGNPFFTSDAKADVVESDAPEPADPEAGSEKAALKAELKARGVEVKGNPSLETLRGKLAAAVAE